MLDMTTVLDRIPVAELEVGDAICVDEYQSRPFVVETIENRLVPSIWGGMALLIIVNDYWRFVPGRHTVYLIDDTNR